MLKSRLLLCWLHRTPLLLLTTLITVISFAPPAYQSVALQDTAPMPVRASDDPWLIRDDAGLFDRERMNRFQFDLRRLQGLGENVVVYTRRSDASAEESEEFADRLREAWHVESTPGADDGLVILMTISGADSRGSSFILSPGDNFFPVGQMDSSDLERVYEEEIEPSFRENRYDVALAYGVRRVLYAADYTPPEPHALTGVQAFVHEVGKIGGVLLLQAAILGLAVVPALEERRLTTRPLRRTVLSYASIFGLGAMWLGLFSILGRSVLGIVMTILVLALVLLVTAVFFRRPAAAGSGVQRVRVRSSFARNHDRMQRSTHHRRERYVPQT